jgi:hypothetical protein
MFTRHPGASEAMAIVNGQGLLNGYAVADEKLKFCGRGRLPHYLNPLYCWENQ